MSDLAAFLNARWTELEALAKATTPVPVPGRWRAARHKNAEDDAPLALIQGQDHYERPGDPDDYRYGLPVIVLGHDWQDSETEVEANLRFSAAVDPAYVLAEIAAKRAIIAEHATVHRNIGWLDDGDEEHDEIPVCGRCVPKHSHYLSRAEVPEGPCRTRRLLAAQFAGHPDYQPEWTP